jgi:hypothetical protein
MRAGRGTATDMPDPAAEPVLRTLVLSSEAVPRSVLAK